MSKSLIQKFRNRVDRLAPHIVLQQMSEIGVREMPKVIQRLYALATDQDPKIALEAIDKILKFSGTLEFVAAGVKIAADSATPAEEGDDEEKERDAHRKRVAKRFAV